MLLSREIDAAVAREARWRRRDLDQADDDQAAQLADGRAAMDEPLPPSAPPPRPAAAGGPPVSRPSPLAVDLAALAAAERARTPPATSADLAALVAGELDDDQAARVLDRVAVDPAAADALR